MPYPFDKCPICGKPFEDCPHNIADALRREEEKDQDKRLRRIVRQEIEKALKERNL